MRKFAAAVVFAAVAVSAQAADPQTASCKRMTRSAVAADSTLLVRVKGSTAADRMRLEVAPGAAIDRAVRIYSEPSHTLVAVVIDPDFRRSTAGTEWLLRATTGSTGHAIATRSLRGSETEFSLPATVRAAGDEAFAVWAYGERFDDRLVVDVKVNPADWGFSVWQSKATGGTFATTQLCW